MSDTVITVENVSKRYIIGHQAAKGDGLRHAIEHAVRSPFRWLRSRQEAKAKTREEFWALNDVSFEIKQGEVVGVIGRNGAGKSTLLKILSRITEPTRGRVHIRGRVASLLEVGTGFHPELTGRENIFLNGAVLGMSRAEIKRKFDEIVAFSEIERFLDTPVKHYSSGMYVRLAFAVAAHLEPEILIVDEVLAVGDAQFQKKCLGKMEDVSTKQGRTILLVSHQMTVIQNLCSRCILLDRGRLVQQGKTNDIVNAYAANAATLATSRLSERNDRTGKGDVRITSIDIRDRAGSSIEKAVSGMDAAISLSYFVKAGMDLRKCVVCVEIAKDLKTFFALSTALVDNKELRMSGKGRLDFLVPDWPLSGGTYHVNIYVDSDRVLQDYLNDAAKIDVVDGDYYGTGKLCHEGWQGQSVLVHHSWCVHEDSPEAQSSSTVVR